MFEDASAAMDYLFAGKGIVTLRSVRTGMHFTFKVARPKGHQPGGPLFDSVLVGGGEYRYLGMLSGAREFRTTAKSCPAKDTKAATASKFCVDGLNSGVIPDMLEISHEGRCGHCARLITTPSSLASGIGPECAAKVGTAAPQAGAEARRQGDRPLRGGRAGDGQPRA